MTKFLSYSVKMKILIASDLAPTEDNEELFVNGKIRENIDKEFIDIWDKSDYRIINLEIVLGSKEKLKPLLKAGPNLICNPQCIKGINEFKPNLLLLSNNHILDYGIDGLENTIEILKANNINFTGIIENNKQELLPYVLEKNGMRVGIYNVCENEFSVAKENSKGANPFIESKCYYEISKSKQIFDRIIVVFHGGKEFYRYPSPNLQRIAHAFIDFGADAVIIQHTHCIGCEEEYKNRKILYGQGNFIFNNDKFVQDKSLLNTSLLLELDIQKDNMDIKYYPLERSNGLIALSKNDSIMKDFYSRSLEIKNDEILKEKYKRFADENLNNYLKSFDRKKFFNRLLNKFFIKNLYKKINKTEDYLSILNIIECEAHRELLLEGIKNQIYKE